MAAGAAVLVWQLLLPGFTGIANNGDFGKVCAWLSLAPKGGETNFVYFQPVYERRGANYWNSPYHSSETALAWVATRVAGVTDEFDIRWLGGVHAVLWLAALGVLLAGLRGRAAAIAILPVVMFTDVCYAAYFNSFYMDAAALCGLLLMTAIAVWMGERPRTGQVILFSAAAVLFATSKGQHAIWAVLPALWLMARVRTRAAWVGATVVLAAGGWMIAASDRTYRAQAIFNVAFFRLGPRGADLTELGVRPEELRYRGMHSYTAGAPVTDREWAEKFYARTGFARLARWYARHPASTARILWATLAEGGPEMRPVNLGNYRVEDGHAAGARTERFALWSDLRSRLLARWPWHMVVWYGVFVAACVAVRSWVGLGVALLGAGEFAAAGLGDSLDAGRHLFLFHAATDLTLCFAAAWAIQRAMRHKP
ncbi:MAG: hypothetical protein JWP63_6248 [Candidatus Solibacter sp.]|nr:hypothetical protein [Candidatus Solibacter sp.]